MILTMNTVYHRVGSLGKCSRCTHLDLCRPRVAGPPLRPLHKGENQMMLRTQWDPFEGLRGQRQGAAVDGTPAWAPALDISERKDAYLVTVELPGVTLDDLQITMQDSLLTIQGERHFAHDSSEQQFHRVERCYGAFRRSITLPAHVMADAVQATIDGGVLQVVVPKAEEAKPKRIMVQPTGGLGAAAGTPTAD